MKYLFIILIAFSFIGCDGDTENSTRTIYATMTIPTNTDNIVYVSLICGASSVQESSQGLTPLASGTTITTDPFVANYVPFNVFCSVTMQGYSNNVSNNGENTEVEISLYVDDQLYETRVVTGGSNMNFIVE